MENDIAGWRRKIDDIDEKLMALINERAALAVEIGKVKKERGLEVYHPDREREIMSRLRSLNAGPLGGDAIGKIFTTLIEECRLLEHNNQDQSH